MEAVEAEISQISFYLAKGNGFDSVFDKDKDILSKKNAKSFKDEIDGTPIQFYYFESFSTRSNPPWLDFANEGIGNENKIEFSSISKSPNGLLLLKLDNRIMVAAFGRSSTSFLDKQNLEPDFGIITAMNMCGNEEIRQTKSQSHSIAPKQIDRQVGRPADTFVFGLSEAEDLKYISAHMKGDNTVTLQGRDNLTIKLSKKSKLKWASLIPKCREFIAASQMKDYAHLFPNYRNFKTASAKHAEALDDILIKNIQAGKFDELQIGIPEFLADDEFSYSYTNHQKRDNDVYSFLQSEQLKLVFKNLEKIQISRIKNSYIYAYSHAEDRILAYKRWHLYKCILFEAKLDEKYFVLNEGRWLEVDDSFYASVLDFTKKSICEKPCPEDIKNIDIYDEKTNQNREEIFNKAVDKLRVRAIKFDQAKLRIGEGTKNQEFCDILDSESDELVSIVHCKPYKSASSTAYLFSQAQLYCEAFLTDQVFLEQIREYIQKSNSAFSDFYLDYIKPTRPDVHGQDYEVCLWLLYDSSSPKPEKEAMPLMAQYELKLLHERLRQAFKYKAVTLTFVPVKRTNIVKSLDNKN